MRIGIIGLGLIGGSLGGALRGAGHTVFAYDSSAEAERVARERDLVDEVRAADGVIGKADVIVLCTPIAATIEAVEWIAARMPNGCVLTDVSSVKRPVVEAMSRSARPSACVGGHPMAGKASGIANADPALLRDAPYAVVRTDSSDVSAVETVIRLAIDIGAAPVEIDAESHDAMVARTSHLPQIISTALSLAVDGGRDLTLKGPGLAGMLRLASSPESMWAEILTYNADNVLDAAGEFTNQLGDFTDAVAQMDQKAIAMLMAAGREVTT